MSHPIVDFVPATDALLRAPRLDHVVELPVLGIATRFESNSRYVLGIVEEAFGGWRAVGSADSGAPRPVRVTIIVREGGEGTDRAAPVRHICPDATRVIVHSPGSVGVSDPARGESIAYVTTSLAADRAHFRSEVLEALTLALLSHFDRHPIHAAAIARNGRAVLLAGAAGAGKSTLAYLAHAAGIDVLSDDRVWIQLVPAVRVWGWPGRVRLLPGTLSAFPELAGSRRTTPNGEKVVVDLSDADRSRYTADRVVVCLLTRGDGLASLRRVGPAALAGSLGRGPAAGFDRFPERHDAVVRSLAAHGGWRLTTSSNPRDALPLLRRMLDES